MAEPAEPPQSYEEMFADRFTSEDPEYQKYQNRPADPPPIVEDWRGRKGRDNRYQDRRGHGGGGWRGGHRGQQQWHNRDRDRDRDRNWGHGSGSQGYHSYQRPHYDRY